MMEREREKLHDILCLPLKEAPYSCNHHFVISMTIARKFILEKKNKSVLQRN